jgi:3-oxoacyl-[acyl-carrier-protein] synthase-3
MRSAITAIMAKRRLVADEVEWLLPHFSSNWFRQKLHDGMAELGLCIPFERWVTILSTKGNTGSAALYIMLDELMSSGKVQRGQRILGVVPESSRMIFGFIHFTAV